MKAMRADLPPLGCLPREDQPSSLAYVHAVARSVGVPPFWLEDAAQDIAVTCWRRGNSRPGTIRSAAIDAARRYGPRSRTYVRIVTVPLTWAYSVPAPQSGAVWGVKAALGHLTAKQRAALRRRRAGLPMSGADSASLFRARRKLEEELCA